MNKLVLLMCAAMLALTGCNAVKGVGQDVQKVGGKLEQSAERHGANPN